MTVLPQTFDYAIPDKALRTWAEQRLRRRIRPDGGTVYAFALSGSTCRNEPLEVLMIVTVDAQGRIESATSEAAPGDRGCAAMCAVQCTGIRIECESCQDAIGLTLEQAAFRDWHVEPSGCFCTAANRRHKWRNVFQALHYAATHASASTSDQ
jgi:hypothetical protein